MRDVEMPAVDLIVPARDEQANMERLLTALPWPELRHVIVVDNGSQDATAELARAGGAHVVHEPQRGYGAACLAGLRWIAEQDESPLAVAFLDADLADDPTQLPRLIEVVRADEADLVIGSRTGIREAGALEPHQRFGNALACWLIRLTTGRQYHDLGPMRVVRWTSLARLAMADRTWGWTVEMQFKAARQELRVVEVAVPYRRRQAGRSKISGSVVGSLRAGVRIIQTIVSLWWRDAGRGQVSSTPG